jgi:hypothetical protein
MITSINQFLSNSGKSTGQSAIRNIIHDEMISK